MSKIDLRYELEFGLIRWCAENDTYHIICDLVGAKNFNKSFKYFPKGTKEPVLLQHSLIVKQMEEMMFSKPITWQTLGLELQKKYNTPSYAWYIHAHRTTERLHGHSMRGFALSLLEMDVRERVVSILENQEQHAKSIQDWSKAKNLAEIKTTVAVVWNDLFQVIDECIGFLDYMNYEDVLEEVKEITNLLPKKVESIKKKSQWDMFFHYMKQLTSSPEFDKQRTTLNNLYKIHLKVLQGKELPQNQIETLQEIAII
uniref:hypothetical protein n=1 Tax=Roseivirga sp. TaxID=1964215 RepID=UPI004047D872